MVPLMKWHIVNIDQSKIEALSKKYKFSTQFSRILLEKGIDTADKITSITSPGIKSLHQASLLPDIEQGTDRIQRAIKDGEKILIWGDEDTDGITATVFLFELLKNLNARVFYHIPNRKKEGIGLNTPGIQQAANLGCSLIVTVDCASSDHNEIAAAQEMGIDIVVTDHHEVPVESTPHFPLINPKRADSQYPFPDIAGVMVAFKLGWFIAQSMLSLQSKEWQSIIPRWYPLIFLGTYADRVPLKDENFVLAHLGFEWLQKTERCGIRILREMICKGNVCDEEAVRKMISVFSTGKTKEFGNNVGFQILTENNKDTLRKTISRLLIESEEWHAHANENYKRILVSIPQDTKEAVIFIYNPKLQFDYLGFCASRLKERLSKPVIVASDKEENIIGEARAPGGVNVYAILAKKSSLFLSFGGHKQACGFTIRKEHLDEMKQYLKGTFPGTSIATEQEREMRIIDTLSPEKITQKLKNEILLLTPFAHSNPSPLFLAQGVSLSNGVYSYIIPESGKSKQIEMKNITQTWVGIDGKPVLLDIVYYLNSSGILIIADARPSLFNEQT